MTLDEVRAINADPQTSFELAPWRPRVGKAAAATPIAFRDVLLGIARSAARERVA